MKCTQQKVESLIAIAWEAGRKFQEESKNKCAEDTHALYTDLAKIIEEYCKTELISATDDAGDWYDFIDSGVEKTIEEIKNSHKFSE